MATQLSDHPTSLQEDLSGAAADKLRDRHGSLLLQLNWPGNGAGDAPGTLGLTSCYRREGVSMLAAQLACEAAATRRGVCADAIPRHRRGHRVLLVDANLCCPSVHRTFGLDAAPGLADCLASGEEPAACLRSVGKEGLCVLTAGDPGKADVGLYHSAGLDQLIKSLKAEFDLVVFDLPAIGETRSAIRLASLLDGVVLVVEAERVRSAVARRITGQLGRANVRLMGAVLNKQEQYGPEWLRRTS